MVPADVCVCDPTRAVLAANGREYADDDPTSATVAWNTKSAQARLNASTQTLSEVSRVTQRTLRYVRNACTDMHPVCSMLQRILRNYHNVHADHNTATTGF